MCTNSFSLFELYSLLVTLETHFNVKEFYVTILSLVLKKRLVPLHECFSIGVHERKLEISRATIRNLLQDLVMLT